MAEDFIQALHEARQALTEERRNLAASLAGSHMRVTDADLDRFITAKQAINATDAAIGDEKKIAAGGA